MYFTVLFAVVVFHSGVDDVTSSYSFFSREGYNEFEQSTHRILVQPMKSECLSLLFDLLQISLKSSFIVGKIK
jgi:hypothetical protein